MNKLIKIVLSVILIGFVCFGMFVYFSLAGTPWSKIYYRFQMKDFLANKYNEEIVITKSLYNFKDGKYGVSAHPLNKPELQFSAWQHYDKTKKYRDYYPEILWEQQIHSDFKVLLDELYPEAERKNFNSVMGISDTMSINGEIPHYSEVEHFFSLVITLNKKLTEDIKQAEIEKINKLVNEIKKKNISTDILLVYRDKNDDTKNCEKYISIDFKQKNTYPTKTEIEDIFNEKLKNR